MGRVLAHCCGCNYLTFRMLASLEILYLVTIFSEGFDVPSVFHILHSYFKNCYLVYKRLFGRSSLSAIDLFVGEVKRLSVVG